MEHETLIRNGHIVISESRPDRTLIVLNTFEVEEEPEIPYAPYWW